MKRSEIKDMREFNCVQFHMAKLILVKKLKMWSLEHVILLLLKEKNGQKNLEMSFFPLKSFYSHFLTDGKNK